MLWRIVAVLVRPPLAAGFEVAGNRAVIPFGAGVVIGAGLRELLVMFAS